MPGRKLLLLLTVAFSGPAVLAQQATATAPATPAKVLTFEVATIKPTARTDGSWRLEPTPDGFTGMDISLLKLVGEAYGIYDANLLTGGPPWIDRDRFDLEAKFNAAELPGANNLTSRQRADMLRPLLADRFHLKVHFEPKEFPVYNLVIGKGGPKLHPTKPEDVTQTVGGAACLFSRSRRGYIQVQGCTMKDMEDAFRSFSGRTVFDHTGLTARYDFDLTWTPENTPADSPEATGASIFTALQEQLGLKLEPATAPLDVLVIDSAEKPSEN